MNETTFFVWLPQANAWVRQVNGFGIERRGRTLRTPPYGTGVVTFTPLNAVACFLAETPAVAEPRKAVRALRLHPRFAKRLNAAIYGLKGHDPKLRLKLEAALGLR